MNKSVISVLLFSLLIVLAACRPPDVEGTVLNIQKQLWDDAYASAEKAIQNNPENAEAWFYWGWLNGERKKNYEEMNRGFDKALALNPQQKVLMEGVTLPAEDAIERYRLLLFGEQFNSAVNLINSSNSAPTDEKRIEMLESAKKKLLLGRQLAPDRSEPFQPLAITYLALGDTVKAIETLATALRVSPDDDKLMTDAGSIYMSIGDWDKAADMFTGALEKNPENAELYKQLGTIEAERENWVKSNEYYSKAIELDPANADLSYNIGVSYYNQNQFKEALPYFAKSLEAEPDNEALYRIMGGCYARIDDDPSLADEGQLFLEKAVEKFPSKPVLWEYLAIVYGRKQMSKEANEAFKKAEALKSAATPGDSSE